ncbi:MAG: multidrug effflux MFS transporter [Gammaproteobacteria bacterium]|nr:multidrug effflux MFS transporter [Gammaproteobacteria bacterium]MDH3450241.1 multidrug effflux MFS transporter [Gammaproteobacteria bacterium]
MKFAATSPPRFVTLVLLSGLSVLSLNMFLPSLSNIASEYQADYTIVSLSVAGYLGITALLQLIIGPLSDRYGRRPVVLSGVIIFILASLGCWLAADIWTFLFFRVFQGSIISGAVLSIAIIRDSAPEQEAASQMGYVSMAMAVAPMLGPMVGGILDELFGWRSNFLFFTLLGLATLVLCWIDLGESHDNPSETFVKQFQAYPELLQSRRFWGYTLCITFSVGAFYIFISGVPLIAATFLALSPAALGFYIGTITAGFALGSFLSGRYSRRYPLTTMMIAGRTIACIGLLVGLSLFLAGYINVFSLFGATMLVGLGNGLTMPSANAGALSVRPRLAGSASGLKGALTVGGGAVLTSISGAILTEGGGPYQLLGMMLFCSAVALVAALDVLRIDRRRARMFPHASAN